MSVDAAARQQLVLGEVAPEVPLGGAAQCGRPEVRRTLAGSGAVTLELGRTMGTRPPEGHVAPDIRWKLVVRKRKHADRATVLGDPPPSSGSPPALKVLSFPTFSVKHTFDT